MKTKLFYYLIALLILGVGACTKVEDNIIGGTWNMDKILNEDGSDSLMNVGSFTFNSDGTGTQTWGGSATSSMTWIADKNKSVTISDSSDVIKYSVITHSKKKQEWTFWLGSNQYKMELSK